MKKYCALVVVLTVALLTTTASATPELVAYRQGTTLTNAPDYDWWYGCTPTSAGMVMGYYDLNGYCASSYDNLVPGVDAELSNYGNPGAAVNAIIASAGHIDDFYNGAYGATGDDDPPPFHAFDCLADFMGTSQDSVGGSNGSTWVYNYTDGNRLHYYEMPGHGITDESGMYGIFEYLTYCGYGGDVVDLYNQLTDNDGLGHGFMGGFSFQDYVNEIDAGRPVMLHVEGHTMFGYGYDANQTVYLHDTWTAGQHSMTWGGAYSGMTMYGVTVLQMECIPEPGTLALFGLGLLGAFGVWRRRR
jgi:hypothetical protein